MRPPDARATGRWQSGPPTARAACFGPGNRPQRGGPGDDGANAPPRAADDPILGLVGLGLRSTSAAVYRRDVAAFLSWWTDNPARATTADVRDFLAATCPTPASWDRRRAALAHFYRAGIRAGRWTVNPTAPLPRARSGDWRAK
jgi:hypothetical protein